MGIVFSAFSWTYAAAQIPGGILLDRLGTRLTYTILPDSLVGLHAAAWVRFWRRRADHLPARARALPKRPASQPTAVFSQPGSRSRSAHAPTASTPSASILAWPSSARSSSGSSRHWGWRSLFFLFGGLGIAYGIIWYFLYREPEESPSVNQAELDHIRDPAGASVTRARRVAFSWAHRRQAHAQAADPRRVDRPILRQFDARLLPHLVSDLSRHRAQMDWLKSGILRGHAVHRRLGRRASRRATFRTS